MLFLLGLKCLIKPNHQGQFGSFIHSLADRLHGDHYICHVWKPKCSNKNFSDRNKTFALCSFVIFMFLIFEPSVTKENLWLKTCQQSFIASFIDIKQFPPSHSLELFPFSLLFSRSPVPSLRDLCVMIWMPLRWQWTGVLRRASHGNASQSLWAETDSTQGHALCWSTRAHMMWWSHSGGGTGIS